MHACFQQNVCIARGFIRLLHREDAYSEFGMRVSVGDSVPSERTLVIEDTFFGEHSLLTVVFHFQGRLVTSSRLSMSDLVKS
ncbi:hypothetical protein Bca4012_060912 [Brassica carinata]